MIELMFLLVQATGKPLDYREAKRLADRQEASLTSEQTSNLIASQATAAGKIFAACMPATPPRTLPSFTVVLELDASGRVVSTWRLGESGFAKCVERGFSTSTFFHPPKAPFFSSFEYTFKP